MPFFSKIAVNLRAGPQGSSATKGEDPHIVILRQISPSLSPCAVSAARFLLTHWRIHRSDAKSHGIECNKITCLGIGIVVAVSIRKSGP